MSDDLDLDGYALDVEQFCAHAVEHVVRAVVVIVSTIVAASFGWWLGGRR